MNESIYQFFNQFFNQFIKKMETSENSPLPTMTLNLLARWFETEEISQN